jgi:circadian clock protein KaiC
MRSVGVDLQPMLDDGRLRIAAARPTVQGLEMHLVAMHKAVNAFQPAVVVLDPITNLISVGTTAETKSMLVRLVDFLKLHGITGFFTSLTSGGEVAVEETEVGISSLIDTWLLLSVVRAGGERNRTIAVIKSRGMSHSNQATEYRITSRGLELMDTYLGPSGVLTGSARLAKEAEDRTVLEGYREELALREQERRIRQRQVDARIAGLQEELAVELAQIDRQIRDVTRRRERLEEERRVMSKSRQAFASPAARGHNKRDRS